MPFIDLAKQKDHNGMPQMEYRTAFTVRWPGKSKSHEVRFLYHCDMGDVVISKSMVDGREWPYLWDIVPEFQRKQWDEQMLKFWYAKYGLVVKKVVNG